MPAIAILDYTQDVLSGLNVREYHYVDPFTLTPVEEMIAEQDRDSQEIMIPFAVTIYDDGLDYDEDGNSYFDDYPADHLASSHRTLKGAEIEAAHLENNGIEQWRISIVPQYVIYRYELSFHPLRD